MRTLNNEVKTLTEQVKKLDDATRWAEELTEANAILTAEVTSLRESIDKAKANSIEEYKDSQPFFNLLVSQYGEGFEDFQKQAITLFPNVDFSPIQIKLTVPSTSRPDDEVDNGEGTFLRMLSLLKWLKATVSLKLKRRRLMRRMRPLPLKNGRFDVFIFFFFNPNLRTIWVPYFGTFEILFLSWNHYYLCFPHICARIFNHPLPCFCE